MKHLVQVHVFRSVQSDTVGYIQVAEMVFPSYAKAAQFLRRLDLSFEIWKDDDTLKFRNQHDPNEYAIMTQLDEEPCPIT